MYGKPRNLMSENVPRTQTQTATAQMLLINAQKALPTYHNFPLFSPRLLHREYIHPSISTPVAAIATLREAVVISSVMHH